MPLVIKHPAVVVVADDGTSPVGSDEWNANHLVTGQFDNAQVPNPLVGQTLQLDTGADTGFLIGSDSGYNSVTLNGNLAAPIAFEGGATGDNDFYFTTQGAFRFYLQNTLIGTLDSSGLAITGSIRTKPPVTVTGATYLVLTTDISIIANRAGTITLTLPGASGFPGRWLYVRTITANTVVSDASNVVPLIGGAAGTAILAATAGKWAALQSDSTNWQIMAGA